MDKSKRNISNTNKKYIKNRRGIGVNNVEDNIIDTPAIVRKNNKKDIGNTIENIIKNIV